MNAIGFVEKWGVDEAKGFFKWADEHKKIGDPRDFKLSTSDGDISFNDLKQIVAAFELVESLGGLGHAQAELDHMINCKQCNSCENKVGILKQAIELVEKVNA